MHVLKGKTNSQKRLTYTLATRFEALDVLVLAECLIPNCRLVKLTTPHLSEYVTSYSRSGSDFLYEWADLEGEFENGRSVDLFPLKYGNKNKLRTDLWIDLCKDGLFDFDYQKLVAAKEARKKYVNADISQEEVTEERDKYISEMRNLGAIDWDDRENKFFIFPEIPFLRFWI